MQRYFALNKDLKLHDDDIHHIINVMRMKEQDNINIIYDKITYSCNIEVITNNDIETSIIKVIGEDNELPIEVTIAQSLVINNKFDFIIQKATELGVKNIIPLKTERSIIKIDGNKVDKKTIRWHKIAKEAAEQSHRNIIPTIEEITTIDNLNRGTYDLKIICSVNEKYSNIKEVLQKNKKYDKILIVIGPEGGLSNNEEEKLVKDGFIPVSLGSRILRTETTSLYVMSVINYETMR